MMEKKNKIRFAVLVVLLTSTIALAFLSRGDQNNAVDPSLFRIENLNKIDHVILESPKGKTELQFKDGKWKVNGEFDADKRLIDVLFATIEQAVPKREISSSKGDSIAKALSQSGTTVSFLEGHDVRKKFIAGGSTGKTQAYFQLPDGKTYVMVIPGYRVYVSGIFEAEGILFRDKRIFNFNWRNFRSLESRFPAEPKEDFIVSFKDRYFGIEGMTDIDTTKLNDYLDAVSLLDAREYLSTPQTSVYDSLLKTVPSFTVEVKDIASRSYLLEVFPPAKTKTTVLGRTGKGDLVLFDKESIARLAKKKAYFIRKD
jgi:hypothetical protein